MLAAGPVAARPAPASPTAGRVPCAPRLLHPAGGPGPAGRVPASATPRSGRRCWPRSATPAGTTTRCFLRDDGLLVGYLMTDDLAAAQAAMEATDVNRRWQAEMAPFFVDLPGGRPDLRPDRPRRSVQPRRPARPGAAPGRRPMTEPAPTTSTGSSTSCAPSASRRPRGRTPTRGPGSRCSLRRACRATRTRRSPTRRRCTASPASRRASRCTSRGTRWTTTPTWPGSPPSRASRWARSTRTCSRTTTTCSAA